MMTKKEFQNALKDDLCINCCLRISQGRYYINDSFYPSKTISTNIYISDIVYTQMMGNENMLRHIIRYHVEQAVRDLMNGKCDR